MYRAGALIFPKSLPTCIFFKNYQHIWYPDKSTDLNPHISFGNYTKYTLTFGFIDCETTNQLTLDVYCTVSIVEGS